MKDCKGFDPLITLYLYGELSEKKKKELLSHLALCPSCRKKYKELKEVLKLASEHISYPADYINWERFPREVTAELKRRGELKEKKFPVAAKIAAVAASVLVAFLLFIYPEYLKKETPDLSRWELLVAKSAVIEYLAGSETLLLALDERRGDSGDFTLENEFSRRLLAKKRFIDRELEKPELAKVKVLAAELEAILLNITTLGPQPPEKEIEEIREMVKKKELIMKITLLTREMT
jgi:hypothetical protein